MPRDAVLNHYLNSGRHLLMDTKMPRKIGAKPKKIDDPESDPHKIFVRRCVAEKPKKKDIVDDIKKFIKAAEELI